MVTLYLATEYKLHEEAFFCCSSEKDERRTKKSLLDQRKSRNQQLQFNSLATLAAGQLKQVIQLTCSILLTLGAVSR